MGNDDPSTAAERYGELWADVYDDEHAFMVPSEAQLSVLAELTGDGRALELGVGTGRVALPLAALAYGWRASTPRRRWWGGCATSLAAPTSP